MLLGRPGCTRVKNAFQMPTFLSKRADRAARDPLQCGFRLAESMLTGDRGGNEHIVHVLYFMGVHVCYPVFPLRSCGISESKPKNRLKLTVGV